MISTLQVCCSTRSSPNWLSASLVCVLLITACADARRDQQLEFYALGTEVSVSLYDVSDAQADTASNLLQAHFARIGHDWYPWRPGELQTINTAIANGQPIQVRPRLATVIRRAAEIEALSNERFNAGLGRLTELWGLHNVSSTPQAVPAAATIAELLAGAPGLTNVRWKGDQLTGATTTLMIDLGGIAKGAILEDSVQILRELEINNAIVNIGGDLTVIGEVHGRPAHIGIRSPVSNTPVASIEITSGETIVSSGNYERFVEIGGQRYNHILDPRSGYPIEHTAAVTVVHRDPILADAAATALMVGGMQEFDALTRSLGLKYALLIDASGDVRLTSAMSDRLSWID